MATLHSRTIYLASDHAGFILKNEVFGWLKSLDFAVVDMGADSYDEEDDFTDYISKVAQAVSLNPTNSCGLIFGGSGQGEAMLANRYKGVRATVYYGGDESIIRLSREHNDANVLSIGARFVELEHAKIAIDTWLNLESDTDDKYARRNSKMDII
jgi:ribose 5-phosphate isomerase B